MRRGRSNRALVVVNNVISIAAAAAAVVIMTLTIVPSGLVCWVSTELNNQQPTRPMF